MKNDKPTTLELAQLAALFHPKAGAERESVKQAMLLWAEAERELEQLESRAEYLRGVVAAIYTDTPDEWKKRRDNYPGEQSDIDAKLLQHVPANEVRRLLFKDKSISTETRKKLFGGLVQYAKKHGLTRPPIVSKAAKRLEPDLSQPYYENFHPRYEFKYVISLDRSWPKDEKFVDSIRQKLQECIEMSLHTVRWAVEVRQRQLAESKTRTIPASLSNKQEKSDDSIQHKRTHRT